MLKLLIAIKTDGNKLSLTLAPETKESDQNATQAEVEVANELADLIRDYLTSTQAGNKTVFEGHGDMCDAMVRKFTKQMEKDP